MAGRNRALRMRKCKQAAGWKQMRFNYKESG